MTLEMMIDLLVKLLSAITIVLSLMNVTMVNEDSKLFLSYNVKKFFYALVIMLYIITLKVLFGCTLLKGLINTPEIVRHFLTFLLCLYFCIYNVIFFYIMVKNGFRPKCDRIVREFILGSIVAYLFFKEGFDISVYVDYVAYLFVVWILIVIVRLDKYSKVFKYLVEPEDVTKPTRLFILCPYLTSVACLIPEISIAKSMFLLAMVKALASLVSFDRSIKWVERYV